MVEVYGYSIATIPVVCGAVYALIEFVKYLLGGKVEKFKRFIPLVAGCAGAGISLLMFFIAPEMVPASTWYASLLIGAASGLSAVGVNQIKKQMQGGDKGGS